MRYFSVKNIMFGISAICLLSNLSVAAEENPTAKELFEQMNRRYAELASLSYTVNRTTVSGTKTIEEKWDFRFNAPCLTKVEYYTPVRRLLFVNDSVIWEYIPAVKKAQRTDLAAMSAELKTATLSSTMSHVAVDGLRLGDFSKMLPRVTSVTKDENNIYVIQGQNPRFTIYTDAEKGCLIHSEIYDEKGDLKMQTDASDFVQAGPELWFPQNINVLYRSKNSLLKVRIAMTNISAEDNLAEEIFQFHPPKGVKVLKR